MRKHSLIKSVRQTSLIVIFSFLLGCMFTVNIMPIDKTCRIEDSDREHSIMKNSKLQNPELIIFILSAPKNFDKRNVLRETWLKGYGRDNKEQYYVKHYFVIGNLGLSQREARELTREQASFTDILVLPIHDSYKNLTEKVKHAFGWLNEQYEFGLIFKYVLKCDDDSFVNLGKFVSELNNLEHNYLNQNNIEPVNVFLSVNLQANHQQSDNNNLSLYWGYFSGTAKVKSKGKWKETQWITSDRYVPYALGGGYLLSRKLIEYIAKNAQDLRSFNSEDVSVGLWLAPVNNVLRIHDVRFDTEWTSRGCKNTHLIIHNINQDEMRALYHNLKKKNMLCNEETEKRSSYMYDWTVPPSQCCQVSRERVIAMNRR